MLEAQQPEIEHGQSLLAFRYQGAEPNFNQLLEHAIPRLNNAIEWANFEVQPNE